MKKRIEKGKMKKKLRQRSWKFFFYLKFSVIDSLTLLIRENKSRRTFIKKYRDMKLCIYLQKIFSYRSTVTELGTQATFGTKFQKISLMGSKNRGRN